MAAPPPPNKAAPAGSKYRPPVAIIAEVVATAAPAPRAALFA